MKKVNGVAVRNLRHLKSLVEGEAAPPQPQQHDAAASDGGVTAGAAAAADGGGVPQEQLNTEGAAASSWVEIELEGGRLVVINRRRVEREGANAAILASYRVPASASADLL